MHVDLEEIGAVKGRVEEHEQALVQNVGPTSAGVLLHLEDLSGWPPVLRLWRRPLTPLARTLIPGLSGAFILWGRRAFRHCCSLSTFVFNVMI